MKTFLGFVVGIFTGALGMMMIIISSPATRDCMRDYLDVCDEHI